jgi:hypothetical protein
MSAHLCVPRPRPRGSTRDLPRAPLRLTRGGHSAGARGPRLLTTGTAYAELGAEQRQN